MCADIHCLTCFILLVFLCSNGRHPGTNNLLESVSKDAIISLIHIVLHCITAISELMNGNSMFPHIARSNSNQVAH